MATFLISILAALGIVIIITVLGLILTQILINKADKAQTRANILSEQPQGAVVDMNDLPEAHREPGITVISNDIIESIPHRHRHLMKKTVSVIDQDAQINHFDNKNTTTDKGLTIPTKTDSDVISSNTSIANPLTGKITLEY
jgi:hypothetical protein